MLFRKTYCLLTFLFFSSLIYSQVLPFDRVVDWTNPGSSELDTSGQIYINVLDYNFDSTGVLSNSEMWTDLINEFEGTPSVFLFPAGIYYFDATLILKSNQKIEGFSSNETIFNIDVDGHLIRATGEPIGEIITIEDSLHRRTNILRDSSAFSLIEGDWVRIVDEDIDQVTSSWGYRSTGQINQIEKIENDTIHFRSEFRRSFQDSITIQKLHLVENIGISNCRINAVQPTVLQRSNIKLEYVHNAEISCIESYNCNYAHVEIRNSTNTTVKGSYFQDAFDYGGGGKAYGVAIHFAAGENLVTNNVFNHLRHSILLEAGANGNVLSYNYSINPFWTSVNLPEDSAGDLVLHGNYPYANLFEGNICQNIVIDDSHGQNGPYNTFYRNRAESYGIFMNFNPASDSQNFLGNEITSTEIFQGLYFLNGNDHYEYGNNILGSTTPPGTIDLQLASLYLEDQPLFFSDEDVWPAIGFPNMLNENDIPAFDRYFQDFKTECQIPIISGLENDLQQFDSRVFIYPNPAKNVIKVKHIDLERQYFIFDYQGKLVKIGLLSDSNIDISNLYPGMYVFFSNGVKELFIKNE